MCNRVVGMRRAGSSQEDRAWAFRVVQGAASEILNRHRETGVLTPRPRSGGPKKTAMRQDLYLLRLVRNGRTKPSVQLRLEWMRFTDVAVTTRLVNHRLFNTGYLVRRAFRKPVLQQRQRQTRLGWVRDHLNWRVAHRVNVVFSDESRFLLYRRGGGIRVRR
jgi:hypothetical protein